MKHATELLADRISESSSLDRRYWIGCVIFIAAALASGCVTEQRHYNKDVSRLSDAWANVERGATYRTLVPLFLMEDKDGFGLQFRLETATAIDPHRSYTLKGPTTAVDFESKPSSWPEVYGLAHADTRIRPVELREPGVRLGALRAFYIGQPRYRYPRCEILEGPHQGVIVDMRAICDYKFDFTANKYILQGINEDYATVVR